MPPKTIAQIRLLFFGALISAITLHSVALHSSHVRVNFPTRRSRGNLGCARDDFSKARTVKVYSIFPRATRPRSRRFGAPSSRALEEQISIKRGAVAANLSRVPQRMEVPTP